jgi:muramoyltetrapeptide carboxypeptidase
MGLIVDPPNSLGHGRLWSHVASDSSFEELHAFAERIGIPRRGFDRDHYDVPAEWYDAVVEAGAETGTSRELIRRLAEAGLRRPKQWTLAPRRPGRVLLRPPRLHPGDLVAVVLPAGPVDRHRLDAGVAVLREWGFRVRVPEPAGPGGAPAYLAGSDRERAAQLSEALTDPDVRAVWAARGGYGTQRVLDLLDWPLLATATPRLLVGFSDVTALHQAMAARLGVATLHGPGVAGLGDGDPGTVEATRRLVTEGGPLELGGTPHPAGGTAEGVLVGGNLTLLASSVGTALVHPAAGGVALLEDVGERPYRLDRSLTQLVRSGWFEGVRAVALGRFTACGDPEEVRALLEERLGPLGVPVVHDLPVGHAPTNLPVPLGVRARLDAATGTLSVDRFLR